MRVINFKASFLEGFNQKFNLIKKGVKALENLIRWEARRLKLGRRDWVLRLLPETFPWRKEEDFPIPGLTIQKLFLP